MTQAAKAKTNKETMFTGGFSTFSANDIAEAKKFYGETLGLEVTEQMEGLSVEVPNGGGNLFIYPKENHEPATFTVFNLEVADVGKAVDELKDRGIEFLQYDEPLTTDENGIFWGKKDGNGPNLAWFEDPAGNILSVIEE